MCNKLCSKSLAEQLKTSEDKLLGSVLTNRWLLLSSAVHRLVFSMQI